MKIISISENPDLPETHLLCGLKQLGFELRVIVSPSFSATQPFEKAGIDLIRLQLPSRFNLKAISFLRKLLLKNPESLAHSFTNRALSNVLIASIGLKTKHVAYRGTSGHLSRFDPSSWMTYLNSRVTKISCVSEAVRNYLIGMRIPAEKAVRIYKGHDPSWYQKIVKADLSTLGIPAGALVICMSANMRRVKGADLLLEAADSLNDLHNVHFLMIGEVRDKKVLEAYSKIKDQSRIHLIGYRSDVLSLVKASHIFAMPSREREGLPKAVIEAMIHGIPAVVSNVGGMPELVLNGECGLVVKPCDTQELAAALRKLCIDADLRTALGAKARARIQSDFTIEKTIQQTAALYREIEKSND